MPERPQSGPQLAFQLCLDDADLCPEGPVPVDVSSISGSGLAVLTVKHAPSLLARPDWMLNNSEGRQLRLTARVGEQSISLTAQLVWSEPANAGNDQLELIIDATGTTDWPTIVAAYRGAA